MNETALPPVLQGLAGQVRYVRRATATEFSSSCPHCGGDVHANGEYPDRFRMFTEGKVRGWCRRCGFVWFPDMAAGSISPAELERFRMEQEKRAEDRLRSAQRELDLLRDSRLWEKYNTMLGQTERTWWQRRGIPNVWQDVWQLGWNHDRDAATIPLFAPGGEFRNLKYRLMDESKGKYRYAISGQQAPLFLCDTDADMSGHVFAIEGEIKAAVTYITMDDGKACVVGLPGLSPSQDVKTCLGQAGRVTLVLDPGSDQRGPDGWSPMGRLVRDIGRHKCAVVIPPMKIDDGILQAGLDSRDVRCLLGSAVMC